MVISDDLIEAYLKCKTKAYLLFLADPGWLRLTDSIGEWQWKIRNDFRCEYINTLTSENQNVCFIGALTKDQLKLRKYQWIINPEITSDDLASKPELLENTSFHSPKTSNGNYIPIRLFPSEKINKYHKQLLAFDALVFGKFTGQFPTFGKIVYGQQQLVARVKLNELIPKVELLVEDLRAMLEKNVAPLFALNRHCPECEFESQCRDKAAKDDDLSLLGGISPKEMLKLRSKGIFTITQLSYTFRPRRRKSRSSIKRYDKYHYALKALAIREKTTYIAGTPDFAPDGTLV
jgi:predicted RecB family nuclease